jgi:Xaa-Pro aminopeptidase
MCREVDIDAFIVTGIEDIRYLSNFSGHDSWLLVLPRSVVLITDSRYTEQAQSECVGCKIIQRKNTLITETATLLAKASGIHVVGIENSCSVALHKGLQKGLSVKVKTIKPIVEKLRMIKVDDEVKLIRKANKIAFDSMEWALRQLKPGMTELELAALYEYRLSYYQAQKGFDTIVCFGANGSRNHHQPGRKKLGKNDTILLDFGANYKGYISDTTRSFAFGKLTSYYQRVYETVAHAQKAGIDAVRAGAKLCDVDAAAREVIEASEFPVYGHGTGHGLGLQVHESPYLSKMNKKEVLQTGQVITIEPGIYLPGKLGVRLEDDILVTESGCQIISRDKRFDIRTDNVPLLK